MISVKMVTMKDVALKVGVSHVTVSRVLAGRANVADATRILILDAARELNYQPNTAARSLASHRKGNFPITIEVVICHALNPDRDKPAGSYPMQILQGISAVVQGDGHVTLSLSYWMSDKDPEQQLLRLQRANGVVLLGNSDRAMVEEMQRRSMNFVLVDHDHADLDLNVVVSGNSAGGRMAARYLVEQGHRRIGWLGAHELSYQQRLDGLRAGLQAYGISIAPRDCRISEEDDLDYYDRVIDAWIEEGDLPSAIGLCGSLPTASFLNSLHKHGLNCPADVSLFSLDVDAYSPACRPRPTAVASYPQVLGRKAMERLVHIIRASEPEPTIKIEVPMRLVEGASVAKQGSASRLYSRASQGA